MSAFRRTITVIIAVAVLCGLAYGVGAASQASSLPWQHTSDHDAAPAVDAPGGAMPDDMTPSPEVDVPSEEPSEPSEPPAPEEPEMVPGPALLGPGDEGDAVRDLQARLAQIDWFNADVTGFYGDVTEEAVRGFQAKREIPVTGEVDQRTLNRLHGMTTEPTEAELSGEPTGNTPGPLDPRCETGRVLCVDKSSSTLRWVVDGEVLQTMDARFGGPSTPTREGVFSVYLKDAEHTSSIYGSSMPFTMLFSGGQAVHYSSDFAAVGYNGASHGCVNIRDWDGIAWLFDQVQVGDKVVVYWS